MLDAPRSSRRRSTSAAAGGRSDGGEGADAQAGDRALAARSVAADSAAVQVFTRSARTSWSQLSARPSCHGLSEKKCWAESCKDDPL